MPYAVWGLGVTVFFMVLVFNTTGISQLAFMLLQVASLVGQLISGYICWKGGWCREEKKKKEANGSVMNVEKKELSA